MSETTTTTPTFSLSNLWVEAGATFSGAGIAIATISPFVVGQHMPANLGEAVVMIAGMMMALAKAFGK